MKLEFPQSLPLTDAMRIEPPLSHALALLLFLSARTVTAQDPGFINKLNGPGMASFANAVLTISHTAAGKDILSQLSSGSNDYAVFAPTNEAFDRVQGSLGGADANTLASIIAYHVAAGNFVNQSVSDGSPNLLETATWPDITVARSLLTSDSSPSFVNLEAGKGQACLWARNPKNNTLFFWGQPSNPIALNATQITPTVLLVPISEVLNIPGNLSSCFEANDDDASSLSGLIKGPIMDRFESDATHGFTFFAPNNDAIKAAGSSLTDLAKNETALDIIIGNHYVNGSTFYSTQITNSTYLVSASGQPFTFTTTSNGTYVTSGQAIAKILESNYLVKNGVVHWIDTVLVNLDEDESAARSAYQSATSTAAAGASSTVTGAIGAETATTIKSSGGKKNGANGMLDGDRLIYKLAFLGLAMISGVFCL